MKVYEAMARATVAESPGAVFTLLGDAIMEFLVSLETNGGPPQYQGRFEGAAVTMAEGYARSTGQVGLAALTSGPGVANATNALCCASRNRTPLVVVTGHPADRLHPQYFDQEGFANLVGARYIDIMSPGRALDAIREAFYAARVESRPVILDVERPVTTAEFASTFQYTPSFNDVAAPRRLPPDPSVLDDALRLIGASQRPVILAGQGALRSDAREAIIALAEQVGALLSTTLFVKNWFADDPFDIGVSGLFHERYAGELLAEADLVIGVGTSLNTYTLEGGYLIPNAGIIHIDTKPQSLTGSGRRAECYLQADARSAVEALLAGARERSIGGQRFRTPVVRDQIASGKADPDPALFDEELDRVDARRLVRVVDEAFPGDCPLVLASGHQWGLALPGLRKWRNPQLYSTAFGSIGMALPTAVGVAIGHTGRPVLHIEGDGSVMMNLHTLDTVVQYGLPIFSVVMNDSAFGAEVHQMRAHDLDASLALQHDVDFAAVASSLGCRSAVVRNEAEMRKAVGEFLSEPGPYVVDARIARGVVSVPFRRMFFGQDA